MSLSNPMRQVGRAVPQPAGGAAAKGLRQWVRDNGLSLVSFGLFAIFLVGQSVAGLFEYNQEAQAHGGPALSYLRYLATGHFLEGVFENWESEFLQMAAYVVLTSCSMQRGSAESRKPDEENPQDRDPSLDRDKPEAPGPVKKGGPALRLYEHSLSIALGLLFLFSFVGHAVAGAREYSLEQLRHGEPAASVWSYLGSPTFWFESMQNWQSEFLAVFALVVLSIWLRGKGSPESKPVSAPHSETGTG